jgi:hypothetical protein
MEVDQGSRRRIRRREIEEDIKTIITDKWKKL